MSDRDRDRATIEALKIALQQAADRAWQLAASLRIVGGMTDGDAVMLAADRDRWRAMAAPDWSAGPDAEQSAVNELIEAAGEMSDLNGVCGSYGEAEQRTIAAVDALRAIRGQR